MEKETNEIEAQYPSVELAYGLVKASYDWLLNRLDAVNSRIEFLLTFVASITVAAPVFVKVVFNDITFGALFYAAIGVFSFSAIVGIAGRMYSGLKLISPEKVYNKWLMWSEWEFKKNALYWAGQDFNHNASLVNRKANFAIAMSLLLIVGVLLLVLWVALSK
jgi:hypothetical protein